MNRSEQRKFIRDSMRTLTESMLSKSDQWPEEWDGHELRALIERYAEGNNYGLCSSDRQKEPMARRRTKDFNNEMMTRDI